MGQRSGQLLVIAIVLAAGWAVCGWAAPASKTDAKDASAAIAPRQQAAAQAHWKKALGGDPPPSAETSNLFLYGTVPGRKLKEVGAGLEKQMAKARAALKLDKATWPGKLTVYLMPTRQQFVALVRGIERRNPEPEETGSLDLRRDEPHVIAGPPRSKLDPSIEDEAGQLIAGGLLSKKAGAVLPEWVTEGFGRATVLLAGPLPSLLAEHRKARLILESSKRRVHEVWEADLPAQEAGPLREALIEYLAYSGRFKRFDQFLGGFRVEENRPNPTTLAALKAANVDPNRLDTVWQNWVKKIR
jgi:hypothetical protein